MAGLSESEVVILEEGRRDVHQVNLEANTMAALRTALKNTGVVTAAAITRLRLLMLSGSSHVMQVELSEECTLDKALSDSNEQGVPRYYLIGVPYCSACQQGQQPLLDGEGQPIVVTLSSRQISIFRFRTDTITTSKSDWVVRKHVSEERTTDIKNLTSGREVIEAFFGTRHCTNKECKQRGRLKSGVTEAGTGTDISAEFAARLTTKTNAPT